MVTRVFLTDNDDNYYIEPHNRHTELAIRNKILGDGDFDLEERRIPLQITGEPKDVLGVSEKLLKDIKKREFELGLKFSIYTLSSNGRFLNLPRESSKKKIGKNDSRKERKQLRKKLEKILKKRKI